MQLFKCSVFRQSDGIGYDFVVVWQFCLASTPSVPKSDRKDAEALFKPNKNCGNECFIIYFKV